MITLAVERLLDLAETYYASGRAGLAYLPLRAHFSIGVAAKVYRQIGRQLLKSSDSVARSTAGHFESQQVVLHGPSHLQPVAKAPCCPPERFTTLRCTPSSHLTSNREADGDDHHPRFG